MHVDWREGPLEIGVTLPTESTYRQSRCYVARQVVKTLTRTDLGASGCRAERAIDDSDGVPMLVSTTNEIAGYRTVRHLGLCRGITVRSRSAVGNFFGGIQSIFGGKLGIYVKLAEQAREEAYDHMCANAERGGANAIVAMRYDANEIMDGITEVLAYGTAVWIEPI